MMSRFTFALVACLIVSGASESLAEVDLHSRGRSQEVRAEITERGIWTPIDGQDSFTLNPGGDQFHDGPPGHAPGRQEGVAAAWVRPLYRVVAVSHGDDDGWDEPVSLRARAPIGTPIVAGVGGGWTVTWQEFMNIPEIRIHGFGSDGSTSRRPVIVEDAWLLDAATVVDAQFLVVRHMMKGLEVVAIENGLISPWPYPIDTESTTVQRYDEGAWDYAPVDPLEFIRMETGGRDDPEQLALAWWLDDYTLRYVILDEHGNVGEPEDWYSDEDEPRSDKAVRELERYLD